MSVSFISGGSVNGSFGGLAVLALNRQDPHPECAESRIDIKRPSFSLFRGPGCVAKLRGVESGKCEKLTPGDRNGQVGPIGRRMYPTEVA